MSTTRPLSIDDAPWSRFLLRALLSCAGGMMLDGFIFGTMAVTLSTASADLAVSAWWMGLISAGALIGIFIGGPISGWAADRFGRQKLFTCNLLVFLATCAAQLGANSAESLLAARIAIGVAIGVEYAVSTTLLAEFSPRTSRGAMLSSLQAFWLIGYAIGYFAAYALQHAGVPWRWILASSAVVALLVLVSRLGTPESPRWLASKGELQKARAIVKRHYGAEYDVHDLTLEKGAPVKYSVLFGPRFRTRTAFATIFWTCQITCAFALLLFLPMIFTALDIAGGIVADVVINAVTVLGGAIGVYLCWRLPRRPLVIWSFVLMAIFMLIMAGYQFVPGWFTLAAFALFMLTINAASNLEFVYPAEMFPTEVRSSAVGVAAASARTGSVISAFALPSLLNSLGAAGTLLILAGVCACGALASALWAPETRNLSLLESSAVTSGTPAALAATPLSATADDGTA
ncbi:MAG: sugar porter family MFS transporter [Actinobacteria bacterium]|nr:sugar porter family MFS transporter [Actinomycetota bacterium]